MEVKEKEDAIAELASLYAKEGEAKRIKDMLTELRPLFGTLPKAKTAKVRTPNIPSSPRESCPRPGRSDPRPRSLSRPRSRGPHVFFCHQERYTGGGHLPEVIAQPNGDPSPTPAVGACAPGRHRPGAGDDGHAAAAVHGAGGVVPGGETDLPAAAH